MLAVDFLVVLAGIGVAVAGLAAVFAFSVVVLRILSFVFGDADVGGDGEAGAAAGDSAEGS